MCLAPMMHRECFFLMLLLPLINLKLSPNQQAHRQCLGWFHGPSLCSSRAANTAATVFFAVCGGECLLTLKLPIKQQYL